MGKVNKEELPLQVGARLCITTSACAKRRTGLINDVGFGAPQTRHVCPEIITPRIANLNIIRGATLHLPKTTRSHGVRSWQQPSKEGVAASCGWGSRVDVAFLEG